MPIETPCQLRPVAQTCPRCGAPSGRGTARQEPGRTTHVGTYLCSANPDHLWQSRWYEDEETTT